MRYFLILLCIILNAPLNSHGSDLKNNDAVNVNVNSRTVTITIYVNDVAYFLTQDENGYVTFSHYPSGNSMSEAESFAVFTSLYDQLTSDIFYEYGDNLGD